MLGVAASARGQWVAFGDETSTRLALSTVGGNDGEEKDIATADLNMDGWSDVIVVRKLPFSNPGARQDVLLMNENGVLVDRTVESAPGFISQFTDSRDVFIDDFTGDGWPDVVIANTFGEQPRFYRNLGNDAMGAWLGLVDESATRFPTITTPGDVEVLQFCAVWGEDVNGDTALDLYFSNYKSFGGTRDVLFINDGNGFFTNETGARLGDLANVAFGTSVEIHDMDDDGDNDIVKISTLYGVPPFGGTWMGVLFNDGSGVFNNFAPQEFPNSAPYMFTIGDFNGDSLFDVFNVGDVQDMVLLATSMTPNTNINFAVASPSPSPRTAGFGGNTKAADIDGDGDLDMGVAPIDVDIQNCGGSSDFALLRNDGNGAFSDPWTAADSQNFHVDPHDFAFLDINQDGCLDMFMGLCTGWRVFIQSDCAVAPPLAPTVEAVGGRYLSVRPNPDTQPVAFRVEGDANDAQVACVSMYVQADGTLDATPLFQATADWDKVYVSGPEIIPSKAYSVRTQRGDLLSPPVTVSTWVWGDVNQNDTANFEDVLLVVQGFQGDFSTVNQEAVDLDPCEPDRAVNFADILKDVGAFQGVLYLDTVCTAPCP